MSYRVIVRASQAFIYFSDAPTPSFEVVPVSSFMAPRLAPMVALVIQYLDQRARRSWWIVAQGRPFRKAPGKLYRFTPVDSEEPFVFLLDVAREAGLAFPALEETGSSA